MGMAPDELFAQRLHYIGKVERALLLGHLGMKNNLQEKVAKLLAQIYEIAAHDGVGDLVGLLNCIGRDGREILVEVPRAASPRGTEGRHDLKKMGNVAGRAHRTAESGSGASPRRRAGREYDPGRLLSRSLSLSAVRNWSTSVVRSMARALGCAACL